RVVYAWQNELAKTCSEAVVRNMIRIPVPVLQGRRTSDYLRSLDLMMAVWERLQPWIDAPRLIGLGSVCRRALAGPAEGFTRFSPASKGGSRRALPRICSVSRAGLCRTSKCTTGSSPRTQMAADYGARVKARKQRISNTIEHRSQEMTRWMAAAAARIKP